MKGLEFLVGKEVDIFNPNDTEEVDGLMASGRILRIVAEGPEGNGWLVLANPKTGDPDFAVNLAHVGMIAVREMLPLMEALPGGKLHRLHRTPSGQDPDDEK
jgi:hypothetical protein